MITCFGRKLSRKVMFVCLPDKVDYVRAHNMYLKEKM